MKKAITKSKTSPAPATKTAPVPKTAKASKPAPKKAAAITPAEATAGLAALAAKAVVGKPAATLVAAQVDIGFGNALFLRGAGAGLSWDKGVPMTCVAGDRWEATLEGLTGPTAVKFLINDTTWSVGEDYVLQPGVSATFDPAF